ncbi:MAG: sulfate adenylyltransferase [Planctomycetota bacterium]
MVKPHGSDRLRALYVEDAGQRAALQKEAAGLPKLRISSQAAANAVMLGSGYFNPLPGYMNLKDSLAVAAGMKTTGGLFWPVPIVNVVPSVSGINGTKRIALLDPNVEGNPVLAIQNVEAVEEATDEQMKALAQGVFRTLDGKHPGVSNFLSTGKVFVAGPIQVLNYSYFAAEFPETFRTAGQIRALLQKNGWKKVVAFQTRNPMHRAHEALVKIAMARVGADGSVIHMLLGKLKPGDIPADVRDASIRKMVELYFKPNTVEITGYGFDMLYAGPREAVLHAIFRQNMGASHLIVGRDHAGVGNYYGAFDAQTIFDKEVPAGALQIQIFKADHTAYSKVVGEVIMMCEAPAGHKKEDFINLSGTRVREMLGKGQDLPPEFARPEVARILMKYYQSQDAQK